MRSARRRTEPRQNGSSSKQKSSRIRITSLKVSWKSRIIRYRRWRFSTRRRKDCRLRRMWRSSRKFRNGYARNWRLILALRFLVGRCFRLPALLWFLRAINCHQIALTLSATMRATTQRLMKASRETRGRPASLSKIQTVCGATWRSISKNGERRWNPSRCSWRKWQRTWRYWTRTHPKSSSERTRIATHKASRTS